MNWLAHAFLLSADFAEFFPQLGAHVSGRAAAPDPQSDDEPERTADTGRGGAGAAAVTDRRQRPS